MSRQFGDHAKALEKAKVKIVSWEYNQERDRIWVTWECSKCKKHWHADKRTILSRQSSTCIECQRSTKKFAVQPISVWTENSKTYATWKCSGCKTILTTTKPALRKKKNPLCSKCYLGSETHSLAAQKGMSKRDIFGSKNPNFRGHTKEFECPCGNKFMRYVPPELIAGGYGTYCSRRCRAEFMIMKMFIGEYQGYKMKSTWEIEFAKYLDAQNIWWLYEPEALSTPYGFYRPDFYVPEWESFVEVKGYWRDEESKKKYLYAKKKTPIILADKDYFKSLGFHFGHGGKMIYES